MESDAGTYDDVDAAKGSPIAAALAGAPARLRAVRTQRRMTLTEVARETGISKSTLSRLENGQRRPTLELLLALSKTYRAPLDDLVGAPDVGDPRIRLKPGRVKGRTVIPLSKQPDSMQAWKIVIPTSKVLPEPRSHDGHEWICVLSGRMRLGIADHRVFSGCGDLTTAKLPLGSRTGHGIASIPPLLAPFGPFRLLSGRLTPAITPSGRRHGHASASSLKRTTRSGD